MSYAQGTTVPVEKTQGEIVSLLKLHGCSKHGLFDLDGEAALAFEMDKITYQMRIKMLSPEDKQFAQGRSGHTLSSTDKQKKVDAEVRRRWRSLLLVIKAKMVAVSDKVSTFEQEFLAYAVMSDGRTVGDRVIPELHRAAIEGRGSALALPGLTT